MHKLGLLLALLICLSGCGQKGPLYLPDGSALVTPLETT